MWPTSMTGPTVHQIKAAWGFSRACMTLIECVTPAVCKPAPDCGRMSSSLSLSLSKLRCCAEDICRCTVCQPARCCQILCGFLSQTPFRGLSSSQMVLPLPSNTIFPLEGRSGKRSISGALEGKAHTLKLVFMDTSMVCLIRLHQHSEA